METKLDGLGSRLGNVERQQGAMFEQYQREAVSRQVGLLDLSPEVGLSPVGSLTLLLDYSVKGSLAGFLYTSLPESVYTSSIYRMPDPITSLLPCVGCLEKYTASS